MTIKSAVVERFAEYSQFGSLKEFNNHFEHDFVNLVKYFYPTAKTIEEFWRMSKVAAYRNNYEKETDLLLSVSLDSFKQLVRKLKSKVEVKNPIAYFTGILNRKFQAHYLKSFMI